MLRRRAGPLLLLAVLTAARLAVAAWLPLAPDEAYYWVWSKALAAGYPDHPPMVALWIRAGTTLLGDTPLGIRLLSPLAAALGSLLLFRAGNDLLGRPAGLTAAALLNATLLLGAGAVTITPDTPLLLFWTATLWALARLLATGNGAWFLAAGAAAGLALDSKYTAALLAPAVLLWLAATPTLRPWLRRPHPWAGAVLALLLFVPILHWNADHGWASFFRQGGRLADWAPARALQFLAELLAGQIALATPIIAVLFAAGMALALRRWRQPQWALLAALTLLPAAVFLQHALGDRVQANWPCVIYPATCIAAAGLAGRWRHWLRPGLALGFAVTLLAWVQGIAAPLPLPARLDPTLLRLGGWDGLAQQLARIPTGFVAADSYGAAAMLALLLPPGTPVLGAEPRWALFILPRAALSGRPGLLLRSARRTDPPDPGAWAEITPLGQLQRQRDGLVAETFLLYRVVGRDGAQPIAVLPRPGGPHAPAHP